jgi:ATP-dependent DNA helicase RecG
MMCLDSDHDALAQRHATSYSARRRERLVVDEAQIGRWLNAREDEHVEFKTASNQIHSDDLGRYCTALANERGGYLVLGITPKIPRQIAGTTAVRNLEDRKRWLLDKMGMRIEVCELFLERKRVVVFDVPSRPTGCPLSWEGAFLMRIGESLVPMTAEQLERIFAEKTEDYSAAACGGAALDDLDPSAIETFRTAWRRKSGNSALDTVGAEQLLIDAGLIDESSVKHAALILLGTEVGLRRHLPQAEVIFEYRSDEASTPYEERVEYRKGFFAFGEKLWQKIDSRNRSQHYQDGLFVWDVPTFSEGTVREAILNAVSHRDYGRQGSVFIRQYPLSIEIVSPGGLPDGITIDNILFRQAPRNRLIADALEKCGLVERSGQGMDLMFTESIKEGKRTPDLSGTDDYRVRVTINGEIQDPRFLVFLERIGKDRLASFSTSDLLALDYVHRGEAVPPGLKHQVQRLLDNGVIERVGLGRGVRHILSRQFYGFLGRRGAYTRERGLTRETSRALLLQHLRTFGIATITDFEQVLPALSRSQIHSLLRSLRKEGKIRRVGEKRGSKWELT